MIAHVSIGTRDVARARRFYNAALKPLGYTCLSSGEDSLGYGTEAPEFWINAASHPVPPDDRSGLHVCFTAPSRAAVDGFHKAALMAGGRDNGKPGLRPDYGPNYYAAFAVDPDGYRIEAWCGK
jgi:catechol 2,3-dioxygenase-like lactoylglutathione lyase family enzyme